MQGRVWGAAAAVAVIVASLAASGASALGIVQLPPSPARLVSVGVARYYNGALAAFIFRVDDFTVDPALSKRLPDSIADPGRWFENYQGLLVERVTGRYPWMRLVVGVITYCGSGNCSGGWRLCGTLASRYGWEVASHSRLHARPPRSAADYLGSIEDIEGNITGYRVLTYIEPFGKAGRGEVHALEERGVRVFMTTVPEPPWKPRAGEAYWRVGFTVKASSSLPWKPALQAALRAALVDGGVVVLYTHATSYDWRSPRDLLEAVDYTAGLLEGYQGLVWITTPGELYSYASEASRARVEARIEGDRVVVNVDYDGQPPGGRVWRVPITIEVNGLAPSMVEEVLVDGRAAPRLYGAISAPRPGYSWSGGRLLVSVYPPARVEIVVQPHARIALAPRGLIEGSRALGAARLLAYTIWLPFAAVVCTARRSGRLGLVAGQPGLAKRAGRVSTARYAVLIPARNAASTVGHALRSALAQTVKPVVVAVLDDASSDGTIQAAASVVERQGGVLESAGSTGSLDLAVYRLPSGVRVMLARFHQHTGKAGMVNAALRGPLRGWRFDYVLILDSDTVLEGRYAEKILHAMGSLGYSAANGLILLWKPDRPGAWARMVAGAFRLVGYLILALTVRVAESAVGALGGLNGAALMVERGMLESIGGLPTSTTADDAELTWRAHIGGYSVGIVPAAVAYTVDPGSLRGLWAKYTRVAAGSMVSAARVAPRLARRGRLLQLASLTYNTLGGLPLALSLAHIALLAVLAALGIHPQGLPERLALALPYTPLAPLVGLLSSNPLVYPLLAYAAGVGESALLLAGVAAAYRHMPRAREAAVRGLRYTPLFPLILWLGALATLAAIPKALAALSHGGLEGRW